MEWVETTGKTIDEAKEAALDELGVDATEAEFEIVEAPRPGLFGRLRGEARVRTRVRPAEVRPKNDRRRKADRGSRSNQQRSTSPAASSAGTSTRAATTTAPEARADRSDAEAPAAPAASTNGAAYDPDVTADEVGAAAVDFVEGMVKAFGLTGSVELKVDGVELDVTVDGEDLGVLIGPGGRTLASVQNLARVAAQRRLGDHETRLRVDVAGYRERRKAALESFVRQVAEEVRESGVARLLEPMTSADRKIVHDVLNETEGIVTRSEGDDPQRRVVVAPAP